jgi:hypothetical protein
VFDCCVSLSDLLLLLLSILHHRCHFALLLPLLPPCSASWSPFLLSLYLSLTSFFLLSLSVCFIPSVA